MSPYRGNGVIRVGFLQSVRKGRHYFVVDCRNCGEPIHFLQDPSKGRFVRLPLDGGFSVPCDQCKTDADYPVNEVYSEMAKRNKSSYVDKRPSPGQVQPYPLLPKHKTAYVTYGVGAIEHCPDASGIVARIVSYWAFVEVSLAALLSSIIGTDKPAVASVYLALRNGRVKNDALCAAAETTLVERDLELFQAILRWKDSVEKFRNDMAHGIFGFSMQIPNSLIWVSAADWALRDERFGKKEDDYLRKRSRVYPVATLERVAREIEVLETQIGMFGGYLSANDPVFRDLRYPQLCSEPPIQKELAHLRKHPKNTL